MKYISLIFLLLATTIMSCTKETAPCETANVVCRDTVPTNQLCQAYFVRWFYNKDLKSCTQVGYSGCSSEGFATKEECEACKCTGGN